MASTWAGCMPATIKVVTELSAAVPPKEMRREAIGLEKRCEQHCCVVAGGQTGGAESIGEVIGGVGA